MFLLRLLIYQRIKAKLCPVSKKNITIIKNFLGKREEIEKIFQTPGSALRNIFFCGKISQAELKTGMKNENNRTLKVTAAPAVS